MKNIKQFKFPSCVLIAVTYLSFSLILAFISITITGYKFGISNNVFHIPYVLNLAESQEFLGDAFYASLKHFTSVIWPILRLISEESNVQNVFAVANFLSRAAAFAGLLFLARSSGLNTISSMTICMTATALTPWLQGYSIMGGHGLFIDHFTHSEVTWLFVFLSLTLFSKNKAIIASAIIGIALSINAFVGIWLLLANATAMLASRTPIDIATILKAVGAFILFAAPVIVWISLTIGDSKDVTGFSYIYYIRQYHSGHFLIEATSWLSLARFALVFACGVIATQYVPNKRYWLSVQSSFMLILLIGIPLPYLFDNRFVFNLHLLRSAGIEQAVAIALSAVAGTKLTLNARTYQSQLLGVVVLFAIIALDLGIFSLGIIMMSLIVGFYYTISNNESTLSILITRHIGLLTWACVGIFTFVLIKQMAKHDVELTQAFTLTTIVSAFCLVLFQSTSAIAKKRLLAMVFFLYALGVVAKTIWRVNDTQVPGTALSAQDKSWVEIVDMVRLSNIHGIFLVPVNDNRYDGFQLNARRRVWVDWKQGAAVMWSPSFYNQWMPRYKEVSALETPDAFVNYAQKHGLSNVIVKSESGACPFPSLLKIKTPYYILCQLD